MVQNVACIIGIVPETTPEIVDAKMRAEYKRYKIVKASSATADNHKDGART